MRVRIRRFGKLRLRGKSRYSDSVVVAHRQGGIQQHGGISPPTSRVRCHLPSRVLVCSKAPHLSVNGLTSLPLFELNHPQTVANPFVELLEDARRICKS